MKDQRIIDIALNLLLVILSAIILNCSLKEIVHLIFKIVMIMGDKFL